VEIRRYHMTLPWGTEPTEADIAWRVVLRSVGRRCDQIWLHDGEVEPFADLVSDMDYQRLCQLLGHYLPGPARLTDELVDLLTGWSSPSPLWNNQMLGLVAYEWRLKSAGSDCLVSADGMSILTLWLTDSQAEELGRALRDAEVDGGILRSRP